MLKLQKLFQRMQSQKGAAKIEYVLLVALISIVAMASLGDLGNSINTKFGEVNTAVTGAGPAAVGGN